MYVPENLKYMSRRRGVSKGQWGQGQATLDRQMSCGYSRGGLSGESGKARVEGLRSWLNPSPAQESTAVSVIISVAAAPLRVDSRDSGCSHSTLRHGLGSTDLPRGQQLVGLWGDFLQITRCRQ